MDQTLVTLALLLNRASNISISLHGWERYKKLYFLYILPIIPYSIVYILLGYRQCLLSPRRLRFAHLIIITTATYPKSVEKNRFAIKN